MLNNLYVGHLKWIEDVMESLSLAVVVLNFYTSRNRNYFSCEHYNTQPSSGWLSTEKLKCAESSKYSQNTWLDVVAEGNPMKAHEVSFIWCSFVKELSWVGNGKYFVQGC